MPRFCVECSPNGAICDFCRLASHNLPEAPKPHLSSVTFCMKHAKQVDLTDGCDDFECWQGEVNGWADEVGAA